MQSFICGVHSQDPKDDMVLELAEKVSALMAEEYIGQRAKRGGQHKFRKAMAKVADSEPEEYDSL